MDPRIVLVEPRSPGNVGAAARALKNLGFGNLLLVEPCCDPLAGEARRLAAGAVDRLESARVVPTLDAALEGCRVAVGATARGGRQRKPHLRIDEGAREIAGIPGGDRPALVFGREDRGLTDGELDRCTHLVYLPSGSEYASFNLAQAVLLVSWELARQGWGPPRGDVPLPAAHESREAMFAHLEQALRTIGFLHDAPSASMMRRLRRMFGRAGVTEEETQVFRGIARQILWAAGKAGLEPCEDEPPT